MMLRRLFAVAALASGALVLSPIGCGGDDLSSAGPADGGGEADTIAPPPDAASHADAGNPAEGGPALPPSTAATYSGDQDPRQGFTTGTVRFVDEPTDVVSYALSWVTESGDDKGPFVTVPFAGPTHHDVPLTTPPVDATYFHIVATTKASTKRDLGYLRADNFASSHDVGLTAGKDLVGTVSAVVDTASSKLVVLFQNPSSGLTLRRCALDGTACTSADVVPGRAWPSVLGPLDDSPPRLVIDTASSKLVFTMPSSELGDPPLLARCNLDATGCVVTALVTAPQLALVRPQIFVDNARGSSCSPGAGLLDGRRLRLRARRDRMHGALTRTELCLPGRVRLRHAARAGRHRLEGTSVGDFVTYPTMFTFCDVAGNPCTSVTRTPPRDRERPRPRQAPLRRGERQAPPRRGRQDRAVLARRLDVHVERGWRTDARCDLRERRARRRIGTRPLPLRGRRERLYEEARRRRRTDRRSGDRTRRRDERLRRIADRGLRVGHALPRPLQRGRERMRGKDAGAAGGSARRHGREPLRRPQREEGLRVLRVERDLRLEPRVPHALRRDRHQLHGLDAAVSDWTGLKGAFFDVGLDKLVVAGPDYSVVCDGAGASCAKVVGLTGVVHDEATHSLVDIKGGSGPALSGSPAACARAGRHRRCLL